MIDTELKNRLSPANQRILELRDVDGLSYLLISKALGVPMGTVMSRLARARGQLRQLAAADLAKQAVVPIPG